MNNPQLLIDAIVQQTMVFVAQLATSGGIRAPLAGVANQVFADLTDELARQGVKKKVIADMFGMALRTYHRRSQELRLSNTDDGTTLWEGVYAFVRERRRVSAAEVQGRFARDDPEIVTGILHDLVSSGLVFRTGRGGLAVYKVADQEDLESSSQSKLDAHRYLVWLTTYRSGSLDVDQLAELTRIPQDACQLALDQLVSGGQVQRSLRDGRVVFESQAFDVPLGTTQGWEAAVLDHFQAMIRAISHKLQAGSTRPGVPDRVGGSTWSLDVWEGHPLASEARETLCRVRAEMERLRARIDDYNGSVQQPAEMERVVVYLGQYVQKDESEAS